MRTLPLELHFQPFAHGSYHWSLLDIVTVQWYRFNSLLYHEASCWQSLPETIEIVDLLLSLHHHTIL